MLKILYYIPHINRAYGGVFQYSYGLLSSLAKSDNIFYLYNLNEDKDILELANKYENLHIISKKDSKEPYLLRLNRKAYRIINKILIRTPLKYRLNIPYEISPIDYIVEKLNIDIIHCPYQAIQQSSWKTPAITTMHDVQELYFPEFFTSGARASRAVAYKNAIDNADAVVVSYQHIKNDIIKYFDKPEQNVSVCLLDMQNLWFEKYNKNDIVDLKKHNIPNDFILYPAATWHHKNHLKLLKAIKILRDKKGISVNLVCTGHKNENFKEIEKKIKEYSLENQVSFLGIVTDDVLYSLYQKTKAVIIPTLYEAGSFPLMESILMGIPVVCSNVTSLPETIGKEDFIFDPTNSDDIADKINMILFDALYLEKNIENSKTQAQLLRKNEVVEIMNKIYSELKH